MIASFVLCGGDPRDKPGFDGAFAQQGVQAFPIRSVPITPASRA
jgi:hypothetical protein